MGSLYRMNINSVEPLYFLLFVHKATVLWKSTDVTPSLDLSFCKRNPTRLAVELDSTPIVSVTVGVYAIGSLMVVLKWYKLYCCFISTWKDFRLLYSRNKTLWIHFAPDVFERKADALTSNITGTTQAAGNPSDRYVQLDSQEILSAWCSNWAV